MKSGNKLQNRSLSSKYKLLKYSDIWLYLGYFWVFITIYVCLMPNPPSTPGIEFGDKLMHTAGYIGLFLWFSQIYHRKHHWRPAVGLILLGICIELAQSLTAYRSFEIADMFANTAGVLVGWLLAGTFVSFIFMKFESIVFKEQNV